MATLKEFEEALRQQGMITALSVLDELRKRDRERRRTAPARRVSGLKMTPELARRILSLHGTTKMTQQEIAFKLGVNQGRVNEVIKHRKWLNNDPKAPEAQARDKALARLGSATKPSPRKGVAKPKSTPAQAAAEQAVQRGGQLAFIDL